MDLNGYRGISSGDSQLKQDFDSIISLEKSSGLIWVRGNPDCGKTSLILRSIEKKLARQENCLFIDTEFKGIPWNISPDRLSGFSLLQTNDIQELTNYFLNEFSVFEFVVLDSVEGLSDSTVTEKFLIEKKLFLLRLFYHLSLSDSMKFLIISHDFHSSDHRVQNLLNSLSRTLINFEKGKFLQKERERFPFLLPKKHFLPIIEKKNS